MAKLIRVEAPHFVAGAVIAGGEVIAAAPIIKYAIGHSHEWLLRYCESKGWRTDGKLQNFYANENDSKGSRHS